MATGKPPSANEDNVMCVVNNIGPNSCLVHKNKLHFILKKTNILKIFRVQETILLRCKMNKQNPFPPISAHLLTLNRINKNVFCSRIKSFCELDGLSVQNKSIPPFFYLPYNPVLSVYLRAHWPRSPRAEGSPTFHPLTPSAGQTLTLEQMDNGLYALSPPDHTLLLPALATAFPFTSRCPSSLFLHLPCPALDCLNSQTHSCRHLCAPLSVCVFHHNSFPSSPVLLLLPYITYFIFTLFFPFPPSIHPHPGASFLQCVHQHLHSCTCCALVGISEYDKETETCLKIWLACYCESKSYDCYKSQNSGYFILFNIQNKSSVDTCFVSVMLKWICDFSLQFWAKCEAVIILSHNLQWLQTN